MSVAISLDALLWNRCQKKFRYCTDLLDKLNSSLFVHLDFVNSRPDCHNNRFSTPCSMNSTLRELLATGIQQSNGRKFRLRGLCAALHGANRVLEPVRDSHRRQCGASGILDARGRSAQIERKHCWSYGSYFGVSARRMSKLALAPTDTKIVDFNISSALTYPRPILSSCNRLIASTNV